MTPVFYGAIAGVILGLIIATIIATIWAPPDVQMVHVDLDGKQLDCMVWETDIVCNKSTPVPTEGNR